MTRLICWLLRHETWPYGRWRWDRDTIECACGKREFTASYLNACWPGDWQRPLRPL